MTKVWLVNFAGHDYRPAEQFGELAYVTTGYISLGSLDRVLYEVTNGLKTSQPDDWLLPCGLIVLNSISSSVWTAMHGGLRLLIWDRKLNQYRTMKVDGGHLNYVIDSVKRQEQRPESRPEGNPSSD